MAGERDAVVELEEEGVVTIDLGGDPDLAAAADELEAGGEKPEKPEKPVVTTQRTSKPSAADEAAAVLTQSLKNAEDLRKAAEATAATERTARLATERTLSQRDQEVLAARETAAAAELQTLTTGIENATREVDVLTAELERAGEAGDFKAQAVANAKLAQVAARKDRLEADKANFESRKPAPSSEGRAVEHQPQVSAFEQYVAGFAPKAQTWLRAHPECVPPQVGGSATKNSMMMAGHHEALGRGIQEGSDDYFKVIEEKAGYREPVSAAAEIVLAGDRQPQKPAQTRRPAPSAPPSRDSEQTGATQRSVRLTPQQQEVALFSYTQKPGEAETAWKARAFGTYARELVSAQAEGKIGRATH